MECVFKNIDLDGIIYKSSITSGVTFHKITQTKISIEKSIDFRQLTFASFQ